MAQMLKCSTAKMAVVQVKNVKEAISAIIDILFHYAEWYAGHFGVDFETFCESVWEKFSDPDAEGEECPKEELQRTGKLLQFSTELMRIRVMQADDRSTNLHIKVSVYRFCCFNTWIPDSLTYTGFLSRRRGMPRLYREITTAT